ncbi:hypothetical protein BGZ65_008814, partial [Modicella reniformis]
MSESYWRRMAWPPLSSLLSDVIGISMVDGEKASFEEAKHLNEHRKVDTDGKPRRLLTGGKLDLRARQFSRKMDWVVIESPKTWAQKSTKWLFEFDVKIVKHVHLIVQHRLQEVPTAKFRNEARFFCIYAIHPIIILTGVSFFGVFLGTGIKALEMKAAPTGDVLLSKQNRLTISLEGKVINKLSIDKPRVVKKTNAGDTLTKVNTTSTSKPAANNPIKLGKGTDGNGPAAHKTVSLTLGSLAGCIKRATDLNEDEANLVAGRLDTAVSILAKTRMTVYKCIELLLISQLSGENGAAMDLSKEPPQEGGNKAQEQLAAEIHSTVRTHFTKLPRTIVTKMKKLGWHPDDIPQLESDEGSQEDTEPEGEDGPGETGDTEYKGKFTPGHVKSWWCQYLRLPSEVRPIFCPTASFTSSFALLSESDIVSILWHNSCRSIKETLESKVCSRNAAGDMAKNQYGELFHKLFIGDRNSIRDNLSKAQTSYGKRCST